MQHRDGFILITGASSGMGEATARLLSSQYNLILQGRDAQRLAAVGETCGQQGHEVLLFPYDFAEVSTLGADLAAVLKAEDICVEGFAHFAGMTEVLPMARSKYAIGLRVMNVNYFAATEIIGALLKKKVNGEALTRVVLVGSIVTVTGKKYQPHYCASKGAIVGLTTALACELAPRVRVNCISPGSFNTRILQTVFAEREDKPWNPATLLPAGGVEEIAKVARFLLSDASAYITGQVIHVDGGERFLGMTAEKAF